MPEEVAMSSCLGLDKGLLCLTISQMFVESRLCARPVLVAGTGQWGRQAQSGPPAAVSLEAHGKVTRHEENLFI